jgi:photosystem II stability/assembly factor-like uncharacterized protein
MRNLCLLLILLFPASSPWDVRWEVRDTGVDSNLRGICVVPNPGGTQVLTIWATGSNGAVARSTDSGKTWQRLKIPGAETLDFRGVQSLIPDTAYVMSSGEGPQSKIYKTTDGGKTWRLQYTGGQKSFFLDALLCDAETHCVALSDPVEGKFVLLATEDGEHWTELPRGHMPVALPKEGAFAASNSALCLDRREIYFGTGGPAARVFASLDFGQTWTAAKTPIASGNASSGIFSLSCDKNAIVAVGGDYQNPGQGDGNAAVSKDGGKTWQLPTKHPAGYRSAVGRYDHGFVTVGPTGSEISSDGLLWWPIGRINLNSYFYSRESGKGWAAGPEGVVAQFLDQTKYHVAPRP